MGDLNTRIGYEMRTQRLNRRKTLTEVAKMIGKSKNAVSCWELGQTQITVEDLVTYCNALGCDWIEVLKSASESEGD